MHDQAQREAAASLLLLVHAVLLSLRCFD